MFLYFSRDVVQKWEVVCNQVKDYRMTLDFIEDIEFTSNHPILLDYIEPTIELYFYGDSIDVNKVIGELLIEHQKVTDNWIEFQHYINGSIKWLFEQGQGLLAKGPESITNAYQKVLARNHIKTSVLKHNQTQEESTAIIFGKSFIISNDVEFKRIL